MALLFILPGIFLLLVIIAIKKPALRSRLLLLSASMFALSFYILSTIADLTPLTFHFGGDAYFKAAKILTAAIVLYWYIRKKRKVFFDHVKLLWIGLLLATLFISSWHIPKVVIYVVNIILINLILINTLTSRVRNWTKSKTQK